MAAPPLDPILFRAFRSIVVLTDATEGRPAFAAEALADWLPRWDAWFKRTSGTEDGRSLHLLYGRSLQLLGRDFAAYPEDVIRVSTVAAPLGFGCTATVSVAECQRSWSQVEALIDRAGLGSVYLDGRESLPAGAGVPTVREVVERLIGCRVSLIFIGPPELWREDGLLTSPAVNGTNWQLIPAARGGRDGRPPLQLESPFSPCRERFTVFVTPEGYLYPCQGLIGFRQWSLGHLRDPVGDRTLAPGGDAATLAAWAKTGPGLTGEIPEIDGEDLAPVCRLHRAALAASTGVAPDVCALPAASAAAPSALTTTAVRPG